MESYAEPETCVAQLRPTRLSDDPMKSGRRSQTWSHHASSARHMKHTAACAAFQRLLHRDGASELTESEPVWRSEHISVRPVNAVRARKDSTAPRNSRPHGRRQLPPLRDHSAATQLRSDASEMMSCSTETSNSAWKQETGRRRLHWFNCSCCDSANNLDQYYSERRPKDSLHPQRELVFCCPALRRGHGQQVQRPLERRSRMLHHRSPEGSLLFGQRVILCIYWQTSGVYKADFWQTLEFLFKLQLSSISHNQTVAN